MDLNLDVRKRAKLDVQVLRQGFVDSWPLERETLDAVFTSNYLASPCLVGQR